MAKYKELWRCGQCYEIHDDEDGARECCMPNITEMYGCLECDVVHFSEEEAVDCCGIADIRCPTCSRDYKSYDINSRAIELAGHCNVCNPIYTLDERFAIEDLHYLQTGNHGDLLLGQS